MDLGIAGRTALICASSRGLGSACAWALADAGCNVVINGRDQTSLEANAEAIRRKTGANVKSVVADLNSDEGVETLLSAAPSVDILVNNNGGPPTSDFRVLDQRCMTSGLTANMINPIRITQAVIDGMVQRRFGRIICITSVVVKQSIPGFEISSGARLGLTGFLAGVARTVAHSNVTINFLLPGGFYTARNRSIIEDVARTKGISTDAALKLATANQPAGRMGRPEELGAACAFLCSSHASYITGQSLLMDGGAYPGIF